MAESGTGGLLASLFSDVCGAAKFFRGAVICYGNFAKMQVLDVPECLIVKERAVTMALDWLRRELVRVARGQSTAPRRVTLIG